MSEATDHQLLQGIREAYYRSGRNYHDVSAWGAEEWDRVDRAFDEATAGIAAAESRASAAEQAVAVLTEAITALHNTTRPVFTNYSKTMVRVDVLMVSSDRMAALYELAAAAAPQPREQAETGES